MLPFPASGTPSARFATELQTWTKFFRSSIMLLFFVILFNQFMVFIRKIWFTSTELRPRKKGNECSLPFLRGLSEKIWTSGLLNPIQARYQTALHPDIPHLLKDYIIFFKKSKPFSICFLKKLYFFWKSNLRIVFCSSIFTLNRSETTLIIVNIYLNKNFWILRRFCVRKALKVRRAVLSVRK